MSFIRNVSLACRSRLDEINTKNNKKLLTNSFFAGGVITSICKGEKVKDYDLFFSDFDLLKSIVDYNLGFHNYGASFSIKKEVDPKNPKLERAVLYKKPDVYGNLSVDEFIEEFNKYSKNWGGAIKPTYLSHNALSFSNGVQAIFRFIGEPEEVFTTFDYEHCKTFWRPSALGVSDGKVEFLGKSLESLAKNELIYTRNTRFVLSAISRLNKFISRGWGVAPSSLLSIAASASKVDWNNKEVLREELLGIYGISPTTLNVILDLASREQEVNLDKVIEMLGEV